MQKVSGLKQANDLLRHERKKRGWSQARLAEILDIDPSMVSRWEIGEREPSSEYQERLCAVFKKNAVELGFIEPMDGVASWSEPSTSLAVLSDDQSIGSSWLPPPFSGQDNNSVFILPAGGPQQVPEDWATWFSERLAKIVAMVHQWRKQAALCIELQGAVNQELNMSDTIYSPSNLEEYRTSRRNALLFLASLPAGILAAVGPQYRATPPPEELLPSCTASITACWSLMSGREFAPVERAMSGYLPLLATWAQRSSPYQRTAAYLTSQSCILMGLVSLHKFNFREELAYAKQAVEYATVSGDPILLVRALILFSGALGDTGQFSDMLHNLQKAMYYINKLPFVLQSKLSAELAYAYAKNGQMQEASHSISNARDIFPGEGEEIPAFFAADSGLFQLLLFEGLTGLEMGKHDSEGGHHQRAYTNLAQIDHLPPTVTAPERIRIEVVNQRALLAIKTGNMEAFRQYLIAGIQGAEAMGSQKRRQEAIANWKEARKVWPHEKQVLELADLLV